MDALSLTRMNSTNELWMHLPGKNLLTTKPNPFISVPRLIDHWQKFAENPTTHAEMAIASQHAHTWLDNI